MSGLLNKVITDGSVMEIATLSNDVNYAMINVTATNDTENEATISLFIGTGTEPGRQDLVGPRSEVPAGGVYEVVGRIVSPGEKIWVEAPSGFIVRVEVINEQ